MTLLTVGEGT